MMNQFNGNYNSNRTMTQDMSRTFISTVFMWMFAALGITAATAFLFGTNETLFSTLIQVTPQGGAKMSILGWIVTFAPFIIVLTMSTRMHKMSVQKTVMMYVIYSILMGISLSFIFWAYTTASIFKTFIISASMFGVMAVVGYTTKTDLTKFGSFLFMALIGIIIATIVNVFMHSARMDYIISIFGVLIFTGLTAFDVQKIKHIGNSGINDGEMMAKITVHAALSLYLDFLNLFLYLLRFFGNSRD
ncbi:MAG: Bax inhibitor-1/YccA family protein [Bacteroidales bacterium]|nr:Bax inhibitor-1/YccA family protein [Bacteroidales bacterium]